VRSDLVFDALTMVPNRYLLTKVASKAVRKLHRPGVRIEETINEVFMRFSQEDPIAPEGALPEPQVVQRSPQLKHSIIRGASEVAAIPPPRANASHLSEAALV
jgi:hypothetical protein